MADFLRGMVEVLAAIVVDRLRVCQHGMSARPRVIGKTDQIMRAVEHALGNEMGHVLRAAPSLRRHLLPDHKATNVRDITDHARTD